MADLRHNFPDQEDSQPMPECFADRSRFVALPDYSPELPLNKAHKIKVPEAKDVITELVAIFTNKANRKSRHHIKNHTVVDARNPEALANLIMHCCDPENFYGGRYRMKFAEPIYLIVPPVDRERNHAWKADKEICFKDVTAKTPVGDHRIIPVLERNLFTDYCSLSKQMGPHIVAVTSLDIVVNEPDLKYMRDGFNYEIRMGVNERPVVRALDDSSNKPSKMMIGRSAQMEMLL